MLQRPFLASTHICIFDFLPDGLLKRLQNCFFVTDENEHQSPDGLLRSRVQNFSVCVQATAAPALCHGPNSAQ